MSLERTDSEIRDYRESLVKLPTAMLEAMILLAGGTIDPDNSYQTVVQVSGRGYNIHARVYKRYAYVEWLTKVWAYETGEDVHEHS